MTATLQELALTNAFGAPFLLAYGFTWVICGILWKKISSAYAALATLFQGMIALPIALFIMNQIGAFAFRPDVEEINQLSILLSMSQLLILPLLIAMYQKKHFTLIPFVFSGAGAVHFLLYAWLYQTIIYIVMSILIAVVLAVFYGKNQKAEPVSKASAANACFSTGFILIATGAYFFFSL